MNSYQQRFSVPFDFPVRFTRGLFAPDNPVFLETVTRLEPAKRHRLLFVVDENVAAAHPGLISALAGYCATHAASLEMAADPVRVPGGETAKNDTAHFFSLVEQVNLHGIDRHSFLVVIGGGAVLDMACFAAAIAHRGVRAIRVPTTVLSQDDSGVGVKNGVNLFGKKNFIGAFLPPFAVLNDFDFLETLSHRDKIAGVAEAVKVALIRDGVFFDWLEKNAPAIARGEMEVLTEVVRRAAGHHLEHIRTSGDPFEMGSARPLDFGHWSAHKMESITRNRLRHGEAVALGMALDTVYSMKMGYLEPRQGERVLALLERIGFRLWEEELLAPASSGAPVVLEGIREFREHLGGDLHITLLREPGRGFEVHRMDEARVLESILWLRTRHEGPSSASSAPAASLAAG